MFMTQPTESDPAATVPLSGTSIQEHSTPVPPGFEFTAAQDNVIRALSGKMKYVGVFYVIASVLVGLAGIVALFFMPWIGLVYLLLLTPELLIGIWTISAAHSFSLVVERPGQDIRHLMAALSSLRKLYTLLFWLLIVVVVLMLAAIAVGIFLWTMGLIPGTHEGSIYTVLLQQTACLHREV
jgi:hypothetical protein